MSTSPSVEAAPDPRDLLVVARRLEAWRWAGKMMFVCPIAIWIGFAGLAMFWLIVGTLRHTPPFRGTGAVIAIAAAACPLASIVVAPVGLFLWFGADVRLRAFAKEWLQGRRLPSLPLETGERLGEWIVYRRDDSALVLRRRLLHPYLWNPLRLFVHFAQASTLSALMFDTFRSVGVGGTIALFVFALAWLAAWNTRVVETEVRVTQGDGQKPITVSKSFDPALPSFVRRYMPDGVRFVITVENDLPRVGVGEKVVVIRGLASGAIGAWQRRRLAGELTARLGIEFPY